MQIRQLKTYLNNPVPLLSEKCKRSFFNFVVEFWDTVVNDPPILNWHIPYLCAEMTKMVTRVVQRKVRKHDLVINVPPGSTKSLLTTVFFPAWAWSNWPYLRFIKTSYSSTLSMELAELCRDLIRSEKYQVLFPYIRIKRDKDKKSNFKIQWYEESLNIWKIGGNLFSTSVEGTLTGFHGHFLLVDDPIDPFKAYSKTQIENVNRWLEQVLPTRKVEKSIVPQVMIMQRVDLYDPSNSLLELRKDGFKVKHICLPGTAHTAQDKKMVQPQNLIKYYDAQNGYLDPIRLNDRALSDLETQLGQYGYAAQVQQNPLQAGMGMFQASEVEIVNLEEFNLGPKLVTKLRYWDKAGTQGGSGARTAGVLMAQLRDESYLIMDVISGRWSASNRENMIETTALQDGHDTTVVVEQEPGSGGKESAESTVRRLINLGIPARKDRPTGDKVYRADPWSVVWNRGKVKLVKGDWNDDYLKEHMRFPGGVKTLKDQVDASSGAYGSLTFSKRAGVWSVVFCVLSNLSLFNALLC